MLELEWVQQWWRLHRAEGRPFVLVARDERGVVGIAPLYIRQRERSLAGALRAVMFLGTGEPELEEVCGENAGWLCAPGDRELVTRLVARALRQHSGRWDRLDLRYVGPDTGPAVELAKQLGGGLVETCCAEWLSSRVRVAPIDEYVAAVESRSRRGRFRKLLRQADAAGLELVRASSVDEALDMFDQLVRLHQGYWEGRDEPGACSSPRFREFHRRMIRHYADSDRLWLLGLRTRDGRWAALHYDIEAGDTLYYYLSGIDYAAASKLSPGNLILLHSIDQAATAGLRVLDLMVGDADFKRQLANDATTLVSVDALAPGIVPQAWRGLRNLGRQLRGVLVRPAA